MKFLYKLILHFPLELPSEEGEAGASPIKPGGDRINRMINSSPSMGDTNKIISSRILFPELVSAS